MIYDPNEIITTDGYLEFCRKNNIQYIKSDCFKNTNLTWRGQSQVIDFSNKIAIIGHSDIPTTDEIVEKFDLVFSTNNISERRNSYGIPLGITNDCNDSPIHKIYGDKKIMCEIMKENSNKDNLVYLNFDIKTFPNERVEIFNLFNKKNWVTIGNIHNTCEGRAKFLREIKSSKFVLCPRGNGIDTHRLWETLYMGSIPIVKYEKAHKQFIDLPILFISDWNHITEDFLNQKYEHFLDQEYNMDKLKISYWFDFIKTKIKASNERTNKS